MAIRYFDLNGATAGFGTLTGAWDTTTANWSTAAAGNVATIAYTFTNVDEAAFGSASGTSTTGTATVADGLNVTLNKISTASNSGTQTIAGGVGSTLTLAGTTPTINVVGANLTISAAVAGTNGLTKTGGITLTLSGANTFTGNVSINAGTIIAANASALGGSRSAALTVASGAALEIRQSLSYSSFATSLNGTGVGLNGALNFTTTAGTSSNLGPITLAGATRIRSAVTASLAGDISLGANTLTVSMPTAGTTFTLSGLITGSGGLTQSGSASDRILALTNTSNSFSGEVIVQGRVNAASLADIGSNSAIGTGSGVSTIKLGNGSNINSDLSYSGGSGSRSTNRVIDLAGTTGVYQLSNNVTATTLTYTAAAFTATGSGAKTFSLSATGGATLAVQSIIVDSAGGATSLSTVAGANGNYLVTGLSTYTGTTTIGGGTGTFSFNSIGNVGGGASAFGAPTTIAAGTIALGSGTVAASIVYTGSTASTDRVVNLAGTTGGGSISNNGSGTLTFSNSSGFTATGTGAKNFTLGGSASIVFTPVITNAGGSTLVTLVKTGVNTVEIAGASTATGGTNLVNGTLRVTGSGVLPGAAGSTAATSNIAFSGTLASALEFSTVAQLGAADQVRFSNSGGTAGNGGRLRYIGTTAETLSKTLYSDSSIGVNINSNSVGGSLLVNGSFSFTGLAFRSIYLGGTGTGANELASTITNIASGWPTFFKRDTGTWKLSADNSTWTGPVAVEGGTLQAASASALGTGNVTMSAGTTLQSMTGSGQNGKLNLGGNLDNSAGGIIRIGG